MAKQKNSPAETVTLGFHCGSNLTLEFSYEKICQDQEKYNANYDENVQKQLNRKEQHILGHARSECRCVPLRQIQGDKSL